MKLPEDISEIDIEVNYSVVGEYEILVARPATLREYLKLIKYLSSLSASLEVIGEKSLPNNPQLFFALAKKPVDQIRYLLALYEGIDHKREYESLCSLIPILKDYEGKYYQLHGEKVARKKRATTLVTIVILSIILLMTSLCFSFILDRKEVIELYYLFIDWLNASVYLIGQILFRIFSGGYIVFLISMFMLWPAYNVVKLLLKAVKKNDDTKNP